MRFLVLVALTSACAAQSLDDIEIACEADAQCPQDAWCDLRNRDNVCRSLEHSAPPHILFDGFVVGSQLVPTITVPSNTTTIHAFRLRNDGGSQTYVKVEVAAPLCVHAFSLVRNDGELVDMGKSFDAKFDVDPDAGCPSPVTLAITATASNRVFTFTAMISIAP
jgi:hypothetical protein